MKPSPSAAAEPSNRLETALLAVVCGITALRATTIEAPHIEQRLSDAGMDSQLVSLLFSTILLACFGVWVLKLLTQKQFVWRKAWFGIATSVFIAGGLLTATQASDKRAAITDLVTLAAPMLAGVLLVQLLNCRARIRLALFLIIAVGAAGAVVCADQYFSSNQTLISDYEANPAEHLQRLGIEAGSLEQWMYEHRLYSKGVRGFLLTGNSTATYFLLAIFAGIGLAADGAASLRGMKDKQFREQTLAAMICYALVTGLIGGGLVMTQSKGGIGALIIGLGLFAMLALFGRWIGRYRRAVGVIVLLLIVTATALAVGYGMRHGRLPGGNSMLVRWQYWTSAVEMMSEHPLTGVGGGNFSIYYPAYKLPAASETIQDPHNWALSLLCQYGPLGLLAFMAGVFWPLQKLMQHRFESAAALTERTEQRPQRALGLGLLGVTTALLLAVRPFLVDASFLFTEQTQSAVFGYVLLYLMPAAVLAGVFVLLQRAGAGDESIKSAAGYLPVALACGLLAMLVHNLIDFAIFEPGVWGTFWLVLAILAGTVHNESAEKQPTLCKPPKAAILGLMFILGLVYLFGAALPPVIAARLFKQSLRSEYGRLEVLQRAVEADRLSPDAAMKAAGMMAQGLRQAERLEPRLAEEALALAETARRRDPANFKPLRLQAEICSQLAAQANGTQKTQWLTRAMEAYEQALKRYPGADRMHFDAAQTAESLGRHKTALNHYKAAVQIEDDFRAQFKIMYPGYTETVSRLGQSDYQTAKKKIQELTVKSSF
jgi:O-antigen ligase